MQLFINIKSRGFKFLKTFIPKNNLSESNKLTDDDKYL